MTMSYNIKTNIGHNRERGGQSNNFSTKSNFHKLVPGSYVHQLNNIPIQRHLDILSVKLTPGPQKLPRALDCEAESKLCAYLTKDTST